MPTPSKYTPALATEICQRLSQGEPMAQICRDAHMPGVTTIWEWQQEDAALSETIARARVDGYDAIAARMRLTARGKTDGGGESTADVQRDKLIIETDLKLLAKWDPKRYGEMVKLAGHEGGEVILKWQD